MLESLGAAGVTALVRGVVQLDPEAVTTLCVEMAHHLPALLPTIAGTRLETSRGLVCVNEMNSLGIDFDYWWWTEPSPGLCSCIQRSMQMPVPTRSPVLV